jgi:hypothetical protein
MTRQVINIGIADKGNGDPLRTAFSKVNANFTELYALLSNDAAGTIISTDIIGSVFADDSTVLVDGVGGKIVGPVDTSQVIINQVITNALSTALPADTVNGVIYTVSNTSIAGAKLTILIESNHDADPTGLRHVQTCEAVIASQNDTSDPDITVYGVTHTSTTPLATISAQRNVSTNLVEITATTTQTNANNNLKIRVYAIEMPKAV